MHDEFVDPAVLYKTRLFHPYYVIHNLTLLSCRTHNVSWKSSNFSGANSIFAIYRRCRLTAVTTTASEASLPEFQDQACYYTKTKDHNTTKETNIEAENNNASSNNSTHNNSSTNTSSHPSDTCRQGQAVTIINISTQDTYSPKTSHDSRRFRQSSCRGPSQC